MAALSRGRTLALLAGLAVVLLLGRYGAMMGYFRSVQPAAFGQCSVLRDRAGGPAGAEDMAVDPQTGLAYVSSTHRSGTGGPDGAIYLIDTRATAPHPERLQALDPKTFHPHGVDLFIAADGRKRLFVVNHGADRHSHSIELFDIREDGDIVHAETIRSDAFTSPNDVAAVGPRSFYVTNDPFDAPAWRRFAEIQLGLPLGTVVYFDAIKARVVADGLALANGVLADKARSRLYVAASSGKSVSRYGIAADGALNREARIGLPMWADNLSFGPGGALIVTGTQRPLAMFRHVADPERRKAPTLVAEVDPDLTTSRVIYENDGSVFSGGSIGLFDGARLFIGGVAERGVLFCNAGPSF